MDKKNLILNIIIGILIIAVAGVTISICTGSTKKESNKRNIEEK